MEKIIIPPNEINYNREEVKKALEILEEAISETISEKTGFCHNGFSWNIEVFTELDNSD